MDPKKKIMDLKQETVNKFFEGKKIFEIPTYQRAYSWEKSHLETFLDDLKRHIKNKSDYYYGNFLLRRVKSDNYTKYEIIDGQQRIMTIVIFIRAMINILRDKKDFKLHVEERIERLTKHYLKEKDYIKKLHPVEYDSDFFYSLIIENENKSEESTKSPSQKRIEFAKEFFVRELKKEKEGQVLLELLDKLENTELTTMELEKEKQSVLMFELLNNRGKQLTNMEITKSHLMYQTYVHSGEKELDSNLKHISDIFKEIYSICNRIKSPLNENDVLLYNNIVYIDRGEYKTSIEDVKKALVGGSVRDKMIWIKDYLKNLHSSFENIERFQKSEDYYAKRIKNNITNDSFIHSFIVRGYDRYYGKCESTLNTLFHILEILIFRKKFSKGPAMQTNIPYSVLKNFGSKEKDIESMKDEIDIILNDTHNFSFQSMGAKLGEQVSGNKMLPYLLQEYENHLREEKGKEKNIFLKSEAQIEHISPQKTQEGTRLGYDEYNTEEEFNQWVHCIGNLVLRSKSLNSPLGSKPFKDKLEKYNKWREWKENPFREQLAEIKTFVSNEDPVWKKEQIEKRKKKIVEFARERWDFNSVKF